MEKGARLALAKTSERQEHHPLPTSCAISFPSIYLYDDVWESRPLWKTESSNEIEIPRNRATPQGGQGSGSRSFHLRSMASRVKYDPSGKPREDDGVKVCDADLCHYSLTFSRLTLASLEFEPSKDISAATA